MNAPVLLAQLAGSTTQTPPSPKNLKLEKPQNGQAISVHLDGNTKLDFADIASEKLTFVKVGEKLIILFDNQSTVTVDPVFDSMGKPLTDLAFDMGSDRTLTGEQFAQTFPITTDQSVLPAAGGATGPTGGANFGDATVGALGASGARLALLTGEDTGGGFDNLDDGTPNPSPIPGGVTAVTLNEDGFAEGNLGGTGDTGGTATSVTGSLNVDFGTDGSNRSFAFSLNQPTLAGLTSDGQTVQLAFTTVNGQPVLIGYVGGDFNVAANQVFTVSLDASSLQGNYTFTLLRPLDHPIGGTEDTINLSINVIATDGSGDTVAVTIPIGINDDTPVIGTPADAALTDPLSGNPATQTGSLGISWGADRYNDHVDGGVSATTGATGDRSVVFANTQVTATGDGATAIGTLTSHGETVRYVLLENGTVLVAYTGATAPTSLADLQQSGTPSGEGEGGEGGIANNVVFVVTLSDASNSGSYVVTQYRSLDHDNGSATFQNIDLAFNFTATDSDGDTVNGTLHAVIADTVPVVTGPADTSTLSEGKTLPSEGGGDMPSLLVVGGSFTPKDTGAVSLHIDWRSDNQNPTAVGGAHDRSVTFTAATQTALENLGLTSDGATIIYTISADGTLLTATTAASEGNSARTIFTVQLSDSGNGSYDFTLLDNLDHRGSSEGSQALTFGFIATDSDGDSTVPANFTVNITDDVPTAGGIESQTLSEQTQSGATNGFVSTSLDNVSLIINWGADDVNNNGASIDRKVAFTTAAAPSGLTSNGEAITYVLSENGTLLTASAGERVVFTVKLSDVDSGTYTFALLDNLDHVGANGASIALGFNFTATDADGDPVGSSFSVNINDDVPTTGAIAGETLVESTSAESSNAFIAKALNGISLNVDWNSDDANAGGTNDRSVAFTTSAAPSGLTSNGQTIIYTLSDNGMLLTATAGARTVFTVQLSDTGNGTYTFNLLDNLDHAGANGASLPLTFSFTATDSDGDTTSPASFTVNVTDDAPSIGTPDVLTLVESTSPSSSNAFISATATASLAVDWNSDDNNQVSGPGASDRSVAFTAATLTSLNALHLTSNGTALTYSFSDNGQLLTAKAGGTTVFTVQLSDTANGTYTFKLLDNLDHASGNAKNDLALTFGFTATDSDGDTTVPASFTVHVTDDVPVAGVGDTRGVDEDDLLSGTSPNIFDLQVGARLNIDWNSDDHDGGNVANRSVSFEHTTAADNVAVRDVNNNLVNLTSDGATVHYAIIGEDLVAYTGNNPFFNRVFVVSLDDDNTGSYTFTLLGHVDHPTADGQNTLTFTFDYTATDSDGDKSSSVFSVTVKDDVPTIGNTESESVREDSLPTTFYDTTFPDAPNSTVQLGDLNINWGADNNNSGATNNRSVVFTTAAGATGLTSDGTAIVYSISADGTVLTAKAGVRTVFTVELSDSGDGSYKFTLFDNIDHAASGQNDDSRTLSFGIKATDSDGDSATADFAVSIVDDAPEAHTGDGRTINENDLSNGTSPNAPGLTATGDLNISWGADDANPSAGGGLGDRAVGFRFNSAADNVDAENSNGQNLTLRSDGQTVQYAFDGQKLVGYIGANLASGTRIFEVTLSDANDGSYTFKLLGNLDHPTGSGTNLVNLTFSYTATDGDGDTSSSNFTVTIRDDVPEIGAPVASTLTEDTTIVGGGEEFVPQAALNKSLNINWGADDNNSGTANRSVAFSSSIDSGDSVHTTGSGSPVLKSDGVTVQFLRISDTEIWGMANDNGGSLTINDRKVFHITLSDTGNGTYTFELLDNLDHVGSGQGSALSLQLGFVATDADGDTDSSSFTVTISDDNGRPSIGTAQAVSVDEDGLTGGNTQPATGDLAGAATSAMGSLAISWGADNNNSGTADRSVAFSGISDGQNAMSNVGPLTVDGAQVKLWVVGNTVYGYTGSNPVNGSTPPSAGSQVFTVSLSDLSSGNYTFNLLKHLDHPAGNNENDITLSFGYQATDADGDVTAASTFTVTVNDDSPVTTGAVTAATVLDDDAFAGGNAGGAGDVTNATSATGAVGALFSVGADGFKSVTLGTTTAFSAIYKDANGVAHQESVTWGSASVSGGVTTWTAIGAVSGATVATLAIDANGSYTFTTSRPLVHSTAGASEENLSLTFNYTVTDGDNDPATGSLTVNVNDDTPVSQGTVTAATTLDDEALTVFTPTNAGGASGDVSPDTNTTSGVASSLFTAGADGFKSVAMTSATFSVVYKDANGFALTETATWGSPVVGANGATTWTATSSHYGSAAVLVIGVNGSYTLTVNAPIAHATPGTAEENKALTFNFMVTDGDGDTATGSLTVNVNDDTPVSKGIVTAATTLDDEAQTVFPANAGGVSGDVSPDTNTVSGTAGSLFTAGADGVKSVAMTSATFGVIYKDANGFALTETATWGSPVVGANGATTWTAISAHYGSAAVLVINADGSYSFTVNAPIIHAISGTTEENKALTFNITVTDGDGDTATGSLTVNINDDTVVLGTAVAGFVDEGNLAGGNKDDGYPGDLTIAQGDNGTRSTSGSLAIAFGADGKAATVTGGTSTQTFTFSGNNNLTADLIVTQGTVNHPSASGIVYGGINNPIIINANDSLPFKLDAIDLGLSGAATTPTVILKGYDSNNNLVATYTLSVANVAALTSGTPTHFNAAGTPFANVLIDRLEIYTGNGFNGYVMADNLVVTQNTASGPVVVDAAVTFTDHSNGLANIVVKDANGNDVTASLTSNGQAVHYAMIDAVTLIGYTGATAPTSLSDARVVFSAVLSSASANGAYTFTQNANLDHPIAGQEDDLTFTFNFTAKDGDGDKANGHFTVTVDDDAPTATAAVLTGAVYESELSTATGDLSTGTQAGNADNKNGDAGTDDSILVGNLSSLVSMGADSPGTFVVETTGLSASLTSLTSSGVALTYTVVGNTLIAWAGSNQIFTFAVNASTGAYTFTLKGQIDHVANYVIDNASIPVAAIDQPGEIYAVAAINGNPRAFEGRLPDGDVIISITNSGNTAVNWVLDNTSGGTDYPLSIAANTTIFINVGQISTPPNVHFELTGPGAPNGQTTVNSGHQDIAVTGGTDTLALDLSSAVTVRDGDGDTVALHDQLIVTVTDDAPVLAGAAAAVTVDETSTPLAQVAYGSLKITIGGDKVGAHLDFATDSNGQPVHPAGLTSDGVALDYVLRTTQYGEKQLVAFKHGDTVDNPVFIVALSSPSNPTYIFTLFQNLDHAANSNTLDLGFTVRATDGDGDYVDQAIHINVTDSVPTIPATTVQRAGVQDDALINGNPEPGDTATASGTLSHNFGVDSNGHLSWVSATLPTGGYTSVINGNVFEVYQLQNNVNVKVFTVTLNPTTGEYQVEQFAAIHHPNGAGELGEGFNLSYRVTDGDGDYVESYLRVVVGDDVPVIIGNATQANLLTNGDFSGGSSWHDASYGDWATGATGWEITGTEAGQTGVQLERVPSGYFGVVTSNGEPMVDLGASPGNIAVSQTLNGLTTGQHYTLSFEIGTYDPSSSGLQVYWNGQLVGTYAPGSTMAIQTLDLIAAGGANTVTFKEVGYAGDNTGTYLANVSLVQASSTSLPLFHADIGEDGSSVVSLVSGTNYRFGADGPGSVAFDTAHATISTPTGTTLGVPSISYDPVTGKVTVNPGWGFNGLSEGEIATLSVPFTVTDADGDSKSGVYQFTIHGTNDAVGTSIGFPDTGTMTEYAETDPQAGSTADRTRFNDSSSGGGYNGGGFWIYDDQGDTHTLTVTPQGAGYIGYVTAVVAEETLNDGNGFVDWQYHVTDAQLNFLGAGETKQEVFRILVSDGHGSSAYRDITVTLVGSNDKPVISIDGGDSDHVFLTETNAGLSATGTLSVTDVDLSDTVTANVLSVTASGSGIGSHFTNAQLLAFMTVATGDVTPAGSAAGDLAWTFNSQGQAFDFLPNGWESVLSYTIQVSDGHGGMDTHVVEIKVHGTNDAPVIDLNGAATAGNDVVVTAVEQMPQWILSDATLTDVDSTTMHSMKVTLTTQPDGLGVEGLSFNTSATNALTTAGLTYGYDATTGVLTVTGDASNAVYQTIMRGVVYQYTGDAPSTGDRTVTVVVNDGLDNSITHTATVHVLPMNNAPSLAGPLAATVTEGGIHTLTAAELGYTDPDNTASEVVFHVSNVQHGTITNGGAPATSFTAAELAAGLIKFTHDGSEDLTTTFQVTVEDGNQDGSTPVPGTFTFTMEGVNDAPVITSAPLQTHADIYAAGFLDHAVTATTAADHKFEIDQDIDTQIGALLAATPANMHAVLVGVQAALGHAAGFADAIAAVWDYVDDHYSYYDTTINAAGVRLAIEYAKYVQDGGAPLSGVVVKYEADGPDYGNLPDRAQSMHDNLLGNLDKASIDDKFLPGGAGGSNGPPNGIADVALHDELLAEIAAAGLSGRPYYAGYEDSFASPSQQWDAAHGLLPGGTHQIISGQLTATDVDTNDAGQLSWSLNTTATPYGTMSIDPATGVWSYDLDNGLAATKALHVGDVVTLNFVATVADAHGGSASQTVTITIHGGNDAPVTQNEIYFIDEDQVLTNAHLLANDSDPDGDALTRVGLVTGNPSGPAGSTSVTPAGDLTYTPVANESGYSVLTYQVSDGSRTTPATVTVNVRPIADAAVLTASGGNEDSTFAVHIALGDTDGSEKATHIELSGYPAGTTFNQGSLQGGVWVIDNLAGIDLAHLTMTPPNNYNGGFNLGVSVTVVDHATLTTGLVTDTATSTGTIAVTVNAVNDLPVLTADDATLTETASADAGLLSKTGNILSNDHDVDGDTLSVKTIRAANGVPTDENPIAIAPGGNVTSHGIYGDLVMHSDGSYTYTANAAFDALADGVQKTDVFKYVATDGNGGDVAQYLTVHLTGVNDTPVPVADDQNLTDTAVIDAGVVKTFAGSVLANDHDAENDPLTVITIRPDAQSGPTYLNGATTVAHGVYGDLTINTDGTYTYTPNANYDALGAGVSATDVFKYGASDGNSAHGGFLTFHITGGNDPAVFTGTDTTSLTESNVAQSTGGTLVVNDVDGADTLVPQANAAGSNNYGVFNVNADGTWTYTMNSAHGEFVAGQTYTDKLTVHSADGTAHDLTVNILGTDNNHAPDLVNGTYGGTVTGQVHALPASALVNGSFESGGTGWTVASQAGGAAFSSNFPADGSGNFTVNSFGQVTGIKTQLAQVVDTLPGVQYTLSFQVYTVSTTPGDHLFVNWNGTQVLAVATAQASGGYHTFTATVTGTGHDTLQFAVDDANNNPATFDSWRFDAVSLTPATHYEATSGTIAFSDADVSDVHSVTVTTPVGSNYIGNFVSTVDEATHQVKWTFYASDSALQALSSNSVDQTYTLKIDDGHGGFDTQNVTVTLAKHIDAAPVITSSAQTGFATEDASVGIVNLVQNPTFELPNIYNPVLTPWTVSGAGVVHIYGSGANGSIDAAYLDQNTTLSQTMTTQIGTTYTIDFFMHNYGTPFSVSVNGTPVWTTSNVIQSWTEYSVTFTATSTSTVLSFATTGVNGADIDEVSVQAGTKHIVEGIETNAGTITYTDADVTDTHTVAASGPTFAWSGGSLTQAQINALTSASTFTLNATESGGTGSVAWKHSVADSAIQFLNAGQTLTETYTVTIDDGQGGTTSQNVTITINGTNEPAAPTGTNATLAATEDVTRVLTLADFGYSDADGNPMSGVTITSVSTNSSLGQLLYGTSAVTSNQFISAADIAAGMLNFAPKDDIFTNVGSVSFGFKVVDSTGASDPTANTITIGFDNSNKTDNTSNGNSSGTATAAENLGAPYSFKDSGGSSDVLQINNNASSSALTSLNFLKSSDNLEFGWASSGGNGYGTVLDQYVNGNKYETFQFQNAASYGGFAFSGSYALAQSLSNSGSGNRIVAGTEGSDTMTGGSSSDIMFGNGGHDNISGNSGDDLIIGGLGNDTLSGGNGNDTFVFGLADGNDTINEGIGASSSDFDRIAILTGGAAMSGLYAFDNNPIEFYGDLVIQYNGQQVTVQGHFYGQGYQVELINFDNGSVYGYTLGAGDYSILSGLTADAPDVSGYRTITLSSGSNFVAGELGTANKITGGSGADLIFGGDQADILSGGGGNNLIVGGHGNDTLSAGGGNDVYAFGMTDGTDTITDTGGAADAIFIDTNGAAMSNLVAYDDNNGTTAGNLVIQYNGQQITVNNHFTSSNSAIERISFDGGSVDGYDLGSTVYTVRTNDPSNSGGSRNVDLSALGADNFVAGEDGTANTITGGTGKDLLFGASQVDVLSGGGGNDYLSGGANDDILSGGTGNDVLRGGLGADTFKFGAGHIGAANLDSILDFSNAEGDKIDISGLLDSIAGVQADGSNINNYVHLTQNGGNVLVQVDTTGAGNFSGNTHDVATLVGYGTSNADIVNMVFKNTDHSMTV
ncbi:T1SS-143 repeat domain-containing protein [Tardiphaga sp. 813_E8_N1_3]|uniref:T1SS-143 repeat domain-containing protein n=1 Tax=Tardiphaga sp. 813_E8_N1_3 TaxID=3240760 RepID=UPI003F20357D